MDRDTRRWRLRPALPTDLDAIVAVHLAAFRDLVELRFDWDPVFQAKETRDDVRRHLDQWQVLEVPDHGTRVVGSLWCSRDEEGVCFVNRITVHPDLQGQGIGGQMLADLQAREPALRLSVWDLNRARPLYRRLGFVETGQEGFRVKMTWSGDRPPPRAATVPESLDAVDAGWFAAVLGVPVTSTRRVPALAGFAGTSEVGRFWLQGDGPESVVLKLGHSPSVYPMYEREVATYHRLVQQLPAPTLHAVLDEGERVVLVLEDLTDRVPGHAIEGADEACARSLLTAVAGWQRATWEQDLQWPPRKVLPDGDSHQARARGGWERMDHERFATDPETERAILALVDDLPRALEALAGGPLALAHCDLHAENVVFDGERPIVLDWQNTTMAPAAIDLGGALVCVHPDVLAARRDALIAHYLEALGQPWPLADVRAQLRGAVAYQLGALAWLADDAPTTHRAPEVIDAHWVRLGGLTRAFG